MRLRLHSHALRGVGQGTLILGLFALLLPGCRLDYEQVDDDGLGNAGMDGGHAGETSDGGAATSGGGTGNGGVASAGDGGGSAGGSGGRGSGGSAGAGISAAGSGGVSSGGTGSGGTGTGGATGFDTQTCTAAPGCTCGTIDAQTYQLCSFGSAYVAAGTFCLANSAGILWQVDSQEENDRLVYEAERAGLFVGGDVLTSGSDGLREGDWQWAVVLQEYWTGGPTGAPADAQFNNWSGGAPDEGETEDCMTVSSDGTWSDADCDVAQPFICEQ